MATTTAKKTAVAVLGMHRSGTSLLARLLGFLGVDLGAPSKLVPSDEHNPTGYWEDDEVNRFHEDLLAEFNYSWHTALALPPDWRTAPFIDAYRDRLAALIADRFRDRTVWAWKEPRTCLFLPLWRELLVSREIDLKGIVIIRHPLEVAASLKKRDGFATNKALGIWLNYNLSALDALQGLNTPFVSYDGILRNWKPDLRKCASYLSVPWPEDETDLEDRVASYLKPGLRHSVSERSQPSEELPTPVNTLYAILQDAAARPTALLASALPGLSDEITNFRTWSAFFSPDLIENTVAKENAELKRRLAKIYKTWSWKITAPFRSRAIETILRAVNRR